MCTGQVHYRWATTGTSKDLLLTRLPFEDFSPNTVTSESWGLGLQYVSLQGTQFSSYLEATWIAFGVNVWPSGTASQPLSCCAWSRRSCLQSFRFGWGWGCLGALTGKLQCLESMIQPRAGSGWSETWAVNTCGFDEFLKSWSKNGSRASALRLGALKTQQEHRAPQDSLIPEPDSGKPFPAAVGFPRVSFW